MLKFWRIYKEQLHATATDFGHVQNLFSYPLYSCITKFTYVYNFLKLKKKQ